MPVEEVLLEINLFCEAEWVFWLFGEDAVEERVASKECSRDKNGL